MSGLSLGGSHDELVFAIAVFIIMLLAMLRIDQMFFRPKRRPQPPQPPRKHRVSFVVEEVCDQHTRRPVQKKP